MPGRVSSRRGRAREAGEDGGRARTACGARLWDQTIARPGLFTAAPNGLRLSGARMRVRCSRGLAGRLFVAHAKVPVLHFDKLVLSEVDQKPARCFKPLPKS